MQQQQQQEPSGEQTQPPVIKRLIIDGQVVSNGVSGKGSLPALDTTRLIKQTSAGSVKSTGRLDVVAAANNRRKSQNLSQLASGSIDDSKNVQSPPHSPRGRTVSGTTKRLPSLDAGSGFMVSTEFNNAQSTDRDEAWESELARSAYGAILNTPISRARTEIPQSDTAPSGLNRASDEGRRLPPTSLSGSRARSYSVLNRASRRSSALSNHSDQNSPRSGASPELPVDQQLYYTPQVGGAKMLPHVAINSVAGSSADGSKSSSTVYSPPLNGASQTLATANTSIDELGGSNGAAAAIERQQHRMHEDLSNTILAVRHSDYNQFVADVKRMKMDLDVKVKILLTKAREICPDALASPTRSPIRTKMGELRQLARSASWPSNSRVSEKSTMLTRVLDVGRMIYESTAEELIADAKGTTISQNLLDMLREYRYHKVRNEDAEDLLTKLIYVFSSLARQIEYYAQQLAAQKQPQSAITPTLPEMPMPRQLIKQEVSVDSVPSSFKVSRDQLDGKAAVSVTSSADSLSESSESHSNSNTTSAANSPRGSVSFSKQMLNKIINKRGTRSSSRSSMRPEVDSESRRRSSALRPVGETPNKSTRSSRESMLTSNSDQRERADSVTKLRSSQSNKIVDVNLANLARVSLAAQSNPDLSRSLSGKAALHENSPFSKIFKSLKHAIKSPSPSSGPTDSSDASTTSRSMSPSAANPTALPNVPAKLQQVRTEQDVICRICEFPVAATEIERHSRYCAAQQECEMRRADCDRELNKIITQLNTVTARDASKSDVMVITSISKALGVKEYDKDAISKIHKYLSRVTSPASPVVDAADKSELFSKAYHIIEGKLKVAQMYRDKVYPLLKVGTANAAAGSTRHRTGSSGSNSTQASTRRRSRLSESEVKGESAVSRKPFMSLFSAILKSQRSRTPSARPEEAAERSPSKMPSIQDFEIVKPVSKGAYGKVYIGRKKTTGDLYAIKILKKEDMVRKNMVSHVLAERKVMSLSQAPFIVKLYYAFQSKRYLYLVMEYVMGGDLSSLLSNLGTFPEEMAMVYAGEAVLALDYLHHNGIIHRDIKPDNMLITAEGRLKLTDFGLSKIVVASDSDFADSTTLKRQAAKKGDVAATAFNIQPPTAEEKGALGTPDYLAPELLTGAGHDSSVDWWALGICLYEFLVGIPPYNDESPEKIFGNILSQRPIDYPEDGEAISDAAKDVIAGLLDPRASRRLVPPKLQKHEFFEAYNFEDANANEAPFKPQVTEAADTSYFINRGMQDLMDGTMSKDSYDDMLMAGSGDMSESTHDVSKSRDGVTNIDEDDDGGDDGIVGSLELHSTPRMNRGSGKLMTREDSTLAGIQADLDDETTSRQVRLSGSKTSTGTYIGGHAPSQPRELTKKSALYSFMTGGGKGSQNVLNRSETSLTAKSHSPALQPQQSLQQYAQQRKKSSVSRVQDTDSTFDSFQFKSIEHLGSINKSMQSTTGSQNSSSSVKKSTT